MSRNYIKTSVLRQMLYEMQEAEKQIGADEDLTGLMKKVSAVIEADKLKAMKLDGPLEERRDHEGLTYVELRNERNGTMSPYRCSEAFRRMACLEQGKSTIPVENVGG